MKTKPWMMLLMMLAGWVIGTAWRAVEILQEGRLMDRMSMSALLGAAYSKNNCYKMALKEIGCLDNNSCNIAEIIDEEILSNAGY